MSRPCRRPALAALMLLVPLLVTALAPAAAAVPPPATPTESTPVMVVLDASGSMKQADAPGPRIDAAKRAVGELVAALPDDARVGLTVYGTGTGSSDAEKARGCKDITQLVPVERVDRAAFGRAVAGLRASGYTPIGESLRVAARGLPAEGPRSIVLVSDGEDTCAPPPPCEVAKQLKQSGIDLVVHTIGFKVGAAARAQLDLHRLGHRRQLPGGVVRGRARRRADQPGQAGHPAVPGRGHADPRRRRAGRRAGDPAGAVPGHVRAGGAPGGGRHPEVLRGAAQAGRHPALQRHHRPAGGAGHEHHRADGAAGHRRRRGGELRAEQQRRRRRRGLRQGHRTDGGARPASGRRPAVAGVVLGRRPAALRPGDPGRQRLRHPAAPGRARLPAGARRPRRRPARDRRHGREAAGPGVRSGPAGRGGHQLQRRAGAQPGDVPGLDHHRRDPLLPGPAGLGPAAGLPGVDPDPGAAHPDRRAVRRARLAAAGEGRAGHRLRHVRAAGREDRPGGVRVERGAGPLPQPGELAQRGRRVLGRRHLLPRARPQLPAGEGRAGLLPVHAHRGDQRRRAGTGVPDRPGAGRRRHRLADRAADRGRVTREHGRQRLRGLGRAGAVGAGRGRDRGGAGRRGARAALVAAPAVGRLQPGWVGPAGSAGWVRAPASGSRRRSGRR